MSFVTAFPHRSLLYLWNLPRTIAVSDLSFDPSSALATVAGNGIYSPVCISSKIMTMIIDSTQKLYHTTMQNQIW